MKIGIMTFWWSDDNYGQLLQCYALQKYLRDAGHDAYLIRYDPRNDYGKTPLWQKILKAFNPIKLFNYLKYKLTYTYIEELNKQRNFDGFRNKYIKQSEKIYLSYQELVDNPPDADVYIVGSDQVWNTFNLSVARSMNMLRAYFLDFGKIKIKRIAYAASFGKERVADDFIQEISHLLKNFNYISVREKSGLNICRQCGIDTAELVPDPTLLLKADDYRSLYIVEPIQQVKKPYCFLYMLSNTCNFSIPAVYNWANRKKLAVVYVTGNGRYDNHQKVYASIPEWLYYIDHAEYVITNSFHGAVFSLIFKKRFGIISLTGECTELNNRFYSLFEIFCIKERFIDSSFTVLDKSINWDRVSDTFKMIYNTCNIFTSIKPEEYT
jgi:hypothetical protein